jgi:hypothetical protein
MKKIIAVCFIVLCTASVSYSVNVADFKGLGLSVYGGLYGSESNFGDLRNVSYSTVTRFTAESDKGKAPAFYGFNISYERAGMFGLSQKSILGVSVGYNTYNGDMSKVTISDRGSIGVRADSWKIDTKATSIPINFWYAYKVGRKWKFSGGAGVEIVNNKYTNKILSEKYDVIYIQHGDINTAAGIWDYEIIHENIETLNKIEGSKTQTAIMPNINIGIEWNFIKYAGLYSNFGYRFNGKTSVGDYKEDLTGFTFNIGIRAYPFNW